MENEMVDQETSSLILPVLISGAIGAGLALLLTPKPGSEIRSDISRFAKKTGRQASEVAGEGQAAASETFQSGQSTLAEGTEELSEATGQGRSLLMPVLVSSVVGAAVALLFAPKAGKEMIEDIKDIASSAVEKSKGWYEQSSAAVKDALEKGKEAAAETKEKMRPAA